VRVNGSLSAPLITSTGSPQGCVLSPLLYILYTNDCISKYKDRYFLKFADDTAIVSLLEDNEICHGPVVDDFIKWCDDACLQLNVSKTKDMSIHKHIPLKTYLLKIRRWNVWRAINIWGQLLIKDCALI